MIMKKESEHQPLAVAAEKLNMHFFLIPLTIISMISHHLCGSDHGI